MALSIASQRVVDLVSNAVQIVRVGSSQTQENGKTQYVLPGAFDPLHLGHRGMAKFAERRFGCRVAFEMSIRNVDKPELSIETIRDRLKQFQADDSVCVTRAPRFTQKADLFSRPCFLVGADTIIRIGDARYYAGDAAARDKAIEQLREQAVRFLVFGRLFAGTYRVAETLSMPSPLQKICDFVREHEFRYDISSTDLRR